MLSVHDTYHSSCAIFRIENASLSVHDPGQYRCSRVAGQGDNNFVRDNKNFHHGAQDPRRHGHESWTNQRPDSLTGNWWCSRTKPILLESLGPSLTWRSFCPFHWSHRMWLASGTTEHGPNGCLQFSQCRSFRRWRRAQERMVPQDEESVSTQ